MARGFTSQMARNIFYGGTLFFVLLFAVLIFDTETRIPARSNVAELTHAAGPTSSRPGSRRSPRMRRGDARCRSSTSPSRNSTT
jgi:hypothetical protein